MAALAPAESASSSMRNSCMVAARQAFVPAVEILAFRAPEHVPDALREIFNGGPAVRDDRLIDIRPTFSRAMSPGPTETMDAISPAAAIEPPPSDHPLTSPISSRRRLAATDSGECSRCRRSSSPCCPGDEVPRFLVRVAP
jgi:hypothetical protein